MRRLWFKEVGVRKLSSHDFEPRQISLTLSSMFFLSSLTASHYKACQIQLWCLSSTCFFILLRYSRYCYEDLIAWLNQTSYQFSLRGHQETGCWWLLLVILAAWEAELRRITIPGQPQAKKKKARETPPTTGKKSYAQWHMPIFPDMAGSTWEDWGPGQPGEKTRPLFPK
jgi:hypothetical protein